MSNLQESETNRQAREVAEQLEGLLPHVRFAVAYADDDIAMRVAQAARSLSRATDAVLSASAIMAEPG
jgi:signal transduction histidine kinase